MKTGFKIEDQYYVYTNHDSVELFAKTLEFSRRLENSGKFIYENEIFYDHSRVVPLLGAGDMLRIFDMVLYTSRLFMGGRIVPFAFLNEGPEAQNIALISVSELL
jgi:hypothetical protein